MSWSRSARVGAWLARAAAASCALCVTAVPAIAAAQPTPVWQQPPAPPEPPPSEPERAQPDDRVSVAVLPALRVASGAGIHVGSTGAVPAYVFEAAAGPQIFFKKNGKYTWSLVAEASYTFNSHPKLGGHLAGIGVGPLGLIPKLDHGFGWAPKLVFGATHQGAAVGMRNMLVASLFAGALQVEAGHQWLHVGAGDQHEARFLVGFDPLRTFILLFTNASALRTD